MTVTAQHPYPWPFPKIARNGQLVPVIYNKPKTSISELPDALF